MYALPHYSTFLPRPKDSGLRCHLGAKAARLSPSAATNFIQMRDMLIIAFPDGDEGEENSVEGSPPSALPT